MQRNMPSIPLNACLLAALVLAAAVPPPCVRGAPVADASTDQSPAAAGEPSGEEAELRTEMLLSASPVWETVIAVAKRHEKEFENEFPAKQYDHLDEYKIASLPAGCRHNFSKESCLQRLVFGLAKYMALLKHVEKEYPSSSVLSEGKFYIDLLSNLIKGKLKHPDQVEVLSSIQAQQMLQELEMPDTFHRKMTAYNILKQLQYFLIDGKRAVARKEIMRANGRAGNFILL